MARLPRPPIPLAIKLRVVLRQLGCYNIDSIVQTAVIEKKLSSLLNDNLIVIAYRLHCTVNDLALDHDPALVNREKLIELPTGKQIMSVVVPNGGKVLRYFPDANDPDYLRYRPKPTNADHSHDIKTRVRGDHGQLSDLALARKEKRRVKKQAATRKTGKAKASRPIRSRGFAKPPKGHKHKWPSRPFGA